MSQLIVEINPFHVRVTTGNDAQQMHYKHAFTDFQDHRYKTQLDVLLDEAGLKNRSFETSMLSWSGFKTTLIPSNVFEDGTPDSFFALCYGQQAASASLMFDRLPSQGIVNIYAFPQWVKSYFSGIYPRMMIRHEGSYLIQQLLSARFVTLEIQLAIHHQHFLLCIGEDDKLVYYSSFDYQDVDDILYHLMFTLQQKERYHVEGNLQICNGPGIDQNISEELLQRLSPIAEIQSLQKSINRDLIINSLQKCV